MDGHDKFAHALLAATKADIEPLFASKEKSRRLMEEIHKHLFELGEPTPVSKRTPRQTHLKKVFDAYVEIAKSLDILNDIEFYISRFPYQRTSIPKHRHLQFHAEAYLHEIYVLELRLRALLTLVEREHGKDANSAAIKSLCRLLDDFVYGAFKKITDLRSSHVHRARLNDATIDRLIGIELQTLALKGIRWRRYKADAILRVWYNQEYRKARKTWKKWIANRNADIRKLLDHYFSSLYPAVFNDDETVIYPSNLKPEKTE